MPLVGDTFSNCLGLIDLGAQLTLVLGVRGVDTGKMKKEFAGHRFTTIAQAVVVVAVIPFVGVFR